MSLRASDISVRKSNPLLRTNACNFRVSAYQRIGVSVDDLDAACQRFEDLKCDWRKRLTDGRMRNVAFLLDPDGYSVEVVQNDKYSDKYSV